jgi:hypothetical protein
MPHPHRRRWSIAEPMGVSQVGQQTSTNYPHNGRTFSHIQHSGPCASFRGIFST